MTKVYLAARYSRHVELQGYAEALRANGFEVTSRWIMGAHQLLLNGEPLGPEREQLFEEGHPSLREQRAEFAQHDYDDCMAADVVISFTEPPRSTASRGGRHVEFGMALALGKRCVVVGFQENVFHTLPQVQFFPSWDMALMWLCADEAGSQARWKARIT